jgi:glycosyltransferase involved in cell wall biosynthesis
MKIVGGIERVLASKMNYLTERGYNIYFITSDQTDNNFSYPLSRSVIHIDLGGIKSYSLYKDKYPIRFRNILKFECDFKNRLKGVIKTTKPDILVCNTNFMASVIVNLNIKSKIIVESHLAKQSILKYDYKFNTNSILNILRRIYDIHYCHELKKCDKLVLLTKADYKAWNDIKNRTIIANPISNYPSFNNFTNSKKIICVGRLFFEKGYDILIKAWKEIALKHQEWSIRIYGNGCLRDELNKMICDEGLEKSIFINDSTLDIYEKYIESEFLVLSSRVEGFALVLAENMACGRPCIAFDCPCGPDEIITNEVNGLIAKNGDIKDLANKIDWMINHEKERHEMGLKAHVAVERYKIDTIMNEWISLFNDINNDGK